MTTTTSSTCATWRSKLGKDFPRRDIERDEDKHKAELERLKQLPENQFCADCGAHGTASWASVNLGVFLCSRCGAHHTKMGTHISSPKGCSISTGTYLWGPDEIARMAAMGNAKARLLYGGDDDDSHDERPRRDAPDSEWFRYIVNKYQHKKCMPPNSPTRTKSVMSSPPTSPTTNLPKQTDWEHFGEAPHLNHPAHHQIIPGKQMTESPTPSRASSVSSPPTSPTLLLQVPKQTDWEHFGELPQPDHRHHHMLGEYQRGKIIPGKHVTESPTPSRTTKSVSSPPMSPTLLLQVPKQQPADWEHVRGEARQPSTHYDDDDILSPTKRKSGMRVVKVSHGVEKGLEQDDNSSEVFASETEEPVVESSPSSPAIQQPTTDKKNAGEQDADFFSSFGL